MVQEDEILSLYFKKTGQDFQYVMQGSSQYGPDFIMELALQALDQNKKIVWKEKLADGIDLGQLDYELQPL